MGCCTPLRLLPTYLPYRAPCLQHTSPAATAHHRPSSLHTAYLHPSFPTPPTDCHIWLFLYPSTARTLHLFVHCLPLSIYTISLAYTASFRISRATPPLAPCLSQPLPPPTLPPFHIVPAHTLPPASGCAARAPACLPASACLLPAADHACCCLVCLTHASERKDM